MHEGAHCSNFLFGGRTVTVSDREGLLTPSSIIVDTQSLPKASVMRSEGGVIQTDSYAIELSRGVDLRLPRGLELDSVACATTIAPHIEARDRSISTALQVLLGKATIPEGLDGFMARRQAAKIADSRKLSELAKGLLGLGYGLTPSGDDFLVGVAMVLNLRGENVSQITGAVLPYPNLFSRTMLVDALDGHYAAPVGALGASMALGIGVDKSAAHLLRMGQTSGCDTLAGVWFALNNVRGGTILPFKAPSSSNQTAPIVSGLI